MYLSEKFFEEFEKYFLKELLSNTMEICHNGVFIDSLINNVNITNKGIWYDFGVYESIKVLQGVIFHLQDHLKRLWQSAEIIDLSLPFTKKQVAGWVYDTISKNNCKNALIRVAVYGDPGETNKVNVYIFPLGLTFYPRKFYKNGIKVITFPGERYLPQSKSFNMLINCLSLREAKKQDALEAILIDSQQNATEGTRSNLFLVKKEIIYTPPVSQILEGVTRKITVDLVKQNRIQLVERSITKNELLTADELFITSTSMNIMPVSHIDNHLLPANKPITTKLVKLYSRYQKQYLKEKFKKGQL